MPDNGSKKNPPNHGKDELNMSDWRISLPQHEQARTKDGGKVDFAEFVIDRGGKRQQVTIEAPSRVGLPTAADEDVLIGLIVLSKENQFADQLVRFSPSRLLEALRLKDGAKNYDRLEAALDRLQAVRVTYEATWYDKLTAEVQETHFTGILSEAKLIRHRGRRKKNAQLESYFEWTNNFFSSLQAGNLTDLDLDLYFSLKRPGAKQLYRHLNKRWFGTRKPTLYERDLKEMAAGHLGMRDNKDLKRNFQRCVDELEAVGYLNKTVYQKIRPGVYRVQFDLNRLYEPAYKKRSAPKVRTEAATPPDADRLVRSFLDGKEFKRAVRPREREQAIELLKQASIEALLALTPKVLKTMGEKFSDAKNFGAAVDYYQSRLASEQKKQERREKEAAAAAEKQRENELTSAAKRERIEKQKLLKTRWLKLSKERRGEIRAELLNESEGFIRAWLQKQSDLENPPADLLTFFESRYL